MALASVVVLACNPLAGYKRMRSECVAETQCLTYFQFLLSGVKRLSLDELQETKIGFCV
jgi:hypothetical protein